MSDLDTTPIGVAAAELMERIAEYPEGTELKAVGIVAELHVPDEETGKRNIETPTFVTDPSRIYQAGLWGWARDVAISGEAQRDDDE